MKNGFHFIEILITLAIISILIAIGTPIYSQYFVQAKRLEAATILSQLALAMEKYHIENNTYQGGSLETLKFPELIVKGNYRLTIRKATDHDYLINAKPLGKQTADKMCATLILNSYGEKKITGTGKTEDCW